MGSQCCSHASSTGLALFVSLTHRMRTADLSGASSRRFGFPLRKAEKRRVPQRILTRAAGPNSPVSQAHMHSRRELGRCRAELGTTTAAARAGASRVIVPQVVDQPHWAGRMDKLDVGAAPRSGSDLRVPVGRPLSGQPQPPRPKHERPPWPA